MLSAAPPFRRGQHLALPWARLSAPPREFAVEPGGRTAAITSSASRQLEAVNVSQLR